MLHDKYLPAWQFSEKHSIVINAGPARIWPVIAKGDLSGSWIIRVLLALRRIPARMTTRRSTRENRFIPLEQKENEELIIGLIGQFWKPDGNLQAFIPEDFIDWNQAGYLKATWNFELIPAGNATRVETETRVLCLDAVAMKKFKRYWFFVRPFSGLIRKEMLRGMKKKVERFQTSET